MGSKCYQDFECLSRISFSFREMNPTSRLMSANELTDSELIPGVCVPISEIFAD
jgi:hypothetical protein